DILKPATRVESDRGTGRSGCLLAARDVQNDLVGPIPFRLKTGEQLLERLDDFVGSLDVDDRAILDCERDARGQQSLNEGAECVRLPPRPVCFPMSGVGGCDDINALQTLKVI